MKERKKFFDNNRLNKGHKKLSNSSQSDANVVRKKYQHVLPPIDMLEHYEELNPGTLDKLLDMAEREQNHRHSITDTCLDDTRLKYKTNITYH